MGRRVIVAVMMCVLLFSEGGTVKAANIKSPYITEQAIGKAPEVKAYITGSMIQEQSQVSGSVGKIPLVQKGENVTFENSGEGISYIILLDNSGSVNREQFDEAKKQLVNLRESLKNNDEMTLYTVGANSPAGEKKNVLGRKANASEKKKKKADCKKISNIEYMGSADSKTVLYRSLNEVLASQTSPKMRTVVLLVTDGEDDSKGKDIDKVSTVEEVREAFIPVYGVFLSKKSAGTDKKIEYTRNKILAEKNCRGYYYDCTADESAESVKKAFKTLHQILYKETYVVNLHAQDNRTAGKEKLKLTVDNSAADAVSIDYSDYVKDESTPVIVGCAKKVSKKSIAVTLQDDNGVNLADANEKSNYTVQTKNDKKDGKIWTIESVKAAREGNETVVTISVTEDLYKGDYILKCSNIRDSSQDENKMETSAEFTIEDGVNGKIAAVRNMVKAYWWIGLLLLVIIIGIIVIRVIKKKAVKIVEINPDELNKADRKLIRLTITDRAGAIKDVEWEVEGSLFVGRSEICNIYFDDDLLSKQHFVIEVNKMGCYIEDLESTNGTVVNGVKVKNRRMLLDGDVITVGREKIVFHVPKNQPAVNTSEGNQCAD